jgi:hypothetical protein
MGRTSLQRTRRGRGGRIGAISVAGVPHRLANEREDEQVHKELTQTLKRERMHGDMMRADDLLIALEQA